MKTYLLALCTLGIFVIQCRNITPSQSQASTHGVDIAQDTDRWKATSYRDQNWSPGEGKYFFSETWTWTYLNENLPKDDPNHDGEMTIYVDPPSGTMLLTRGDTYHYGEMADWVIIEPNGQFITHWTDHDGSTNIQRDTMQHINDFDFYISHQSSEFEKYFSTKHEFKTFGKNNEGRPDFYAELFEQVFTMTGDTSNIYFTAVPFSVRPLFFAQMINEELGLPIAFSSFGYTVPENFLPMEEHVTFNDKVVSYSFKSVHPSEYFIELK